MLVNSLLTDDNMLDLKMYIKFTHLIHLIIVLELPCYATYVTKF